MISFPKDMGDIEIMLDINNKQLSQRFLRGQGTILEDEKTWTTNIESDSNQR
jgi:hypothetical protein